VSSIVEGEVLTKGRSKIEGDVVSKRELDNIKTNSLRRASRRNRAGRSCLGEIHLRKALETRKRVS
jgi:hypothetical protein